MFSYNPYVIGNPVGDTEVFVGREGLLKAVEAMVADPHQNAIMLYGQRRVGKTSVLQKLQVRLSNRGQTIFFDLQDKDGYSWEKIKQEWVSKVNDTLGIEVTPDEIEQWLVNQNTLLVFLIDEFNVLWVKNSKIQDESLHELGKLLTINPRYIKWVFTTSSKIEDLPDTAISFRNIPFEFIPQLSQSETPEVIRLSEKNQTLRWSPVAMDLVWQFTGGHPFFTQRLCSYVWDYIYYEENSSLSVPIVEYKVVRKIASGDTFIDPSNQVLNELWRQLTNLERLILCFSMPGKGNFFEEWLLSGLDKTDKVVVEIAAEIQRTLSSLKKWGWLNDKLNFQVELVRIWFERYQLSSCKKLLQPFLGEPPDKKQFSKTNIELSLWELPQVLIADFNKWDILSIKQNQSDEKEQLSVLHLLAENNVEATVTDVLKTSEQLPPWPKKKLIQYLPKCDLVEPYNQIFYQQIARGKQ